MTRFRGGAISNGTRKNFGFATFETEEGLRRTVRFYLICVVSHVLSVCMADVGFGLLTPLKFREGRCQRVKSICFEPQDVIASYNGLYCGRTTLKIAYAVKMPWSSTWAPDLFSMDPFWAPVI